MSYTTYSQQWLEDQSAIRIALVVATVYSVQSAQETTLYFSSSSFTTTDGVTFNPVLVGKVSFTQSISNDGGASLSFSDLEFANYNGEFDDYLDSSKYIWSNRSVQVYYGDPRFQSSLGDIAIKFRLIFDGVIDDVDSRTNKYFNLKIRNKLERLNTPITESKLGTYGVWAGGQTNQDTIKPLVFGECFNITPLLIDPSTLEYMVSDGAVERIIEVRDNGVPIYSDELPATAIYPGTRYKIISAGTTNFTSIGAANNNVNTEFVATGTGTGTGIVSTVGGVVLDLANGKFKLTSPAAGSVTCSVQGIKRTADWDTGGLTNTYTNTVCNLISLIVTIYGNSLTRFETTEIDSTNFNTFNTNNNSQEFGVYVTGTETVLDICQKLASSIGSELIIDSTGKLKLIKYGVGYGSTVAITPRDIMFNSLSIVNRIPLTASIKLGYAKNWTVQSGLVTNIPENHKDSYETEWLTVTSVNNTVRTNHKLTSDPAQKDTYLISQEDAQTECDRLRNYYSVQKTIYKFTCTAKHLSLAVGQPVTLTFPRFGLNSGVTGQVVSISPDWLAGKTEIEVIV